MSGSEDVPFDVVLTSVRAYQYKLRQMGNKLDAHRPFGDGLRREAARLRRRRPKRSSLICSVMAARPCPCSSWTFAVSVDIRNVVILPSATVQTRASEVMDRSGQNDAPVGGHRQAPSWPRRRGSIPSAYDSPQGIFRLCTRHTERSHVHHLEDLPTVGRVVHPTRALNVVLIVHLVRVWYVCIPFPIGTILANAQ